MGGGGGGGRGGDRVIEFFLDLFHVYLCCSFFSFMHVSLHFGLVSFMLAHLRMLSFVFSHVCVFG